MKDDQLNLDRWSIAHAEGCRVVDTLAPGALGLDVPTLRRLFQVTDATLREWVKEGTLAVIKVGERKNIFTKQSVALKIARGFDGNSLSETPSFWAALPDMLTAEQVAEALPGRFTDVAAVEQALATKRLVGRLVPRPGAARILVPKNALRRYVFGLPQQLPMLSTRLERRALAALGAPANSAYASAPPTLHGAWWDATPEPAPETDEWGTPIETPADPETDNEWEER